MTNTTIHPAKPDNVRMWRQEWACEHNRNKSEFKYRRWQNTTHEQEDRDVREYKLVKGFITHTTRRIALADMRAHGWQKVRKPSKNVVKFWSPWIPARTRLYKRGREGGGERGTKTKDAQNNGYATVSLLPGYLRIAPQPATTPYLCAHERDVSCSSDTKDIYLTLLFSLFVPSWRTIIEEVVRSHGLHACTYLTFKKHTPIPGKSKTQAAKLLIVSARFCHRVYYQRLVCLPDFPASSPWKCMNTSVQNAIHIIDAHKSRKCILKLTHTWLHRILKLTASC